MIKPLCRQYNRDNESHSSFKDAGDKNVAVKWFGSEKRRVCHCQYLPRRQTLHYGQFPGRKLIMPSEQILGFMGQFGLANSERRHNICHLGQPTKASRWRPPQCHLQHIQEDEASDPVLAYTDGDCVRCHAMGDGEVRTKNIQDGGDA